jgi:glycosidase
VRNATPALRRGATTLLDGGAEPVIGWLRATGDETLLVVVNVSDEPVTSYGLGVEGGPLCGPVAARLVGTVGGDPGASPAAPVVTPEGGLDGYAPLPVLAPRSGYVIALEPAP